MTTRRTTHAQQIAHRLIQEARNTMGHGWTQIGDELKWGLVSARIVGTIRIQDESTPPEAVLANFNALVDACRAELDGLRIGRV